MGIDPFFPLSGSGSRSSIYSLCDPFPDPNPPFVTWSFSDPDPNPPFVTWLFSDPDPNPPFVTWLFSDPDPNPDPHILYIFN